MRRRSVAVGVVAGLSLMASAPAFGVAPANDNYLASNTINRPDGSLPRQYSDRQDTTEATTQADLFDPNRDGLPFGGGAPEPTDCPGGAAFGKTVWYDFAPPSAGGVRIVATGFDTVVAVYEWDLRTSQLGSPVACQTTSSGPTEEVLLGPEVRSGRNYTIQVGGVASAGGPLDLGFEFFPDRDADGVLDEQPDKCPELRGIPAFGGCPPLVRGSARLTVVSSPGGVVVRRVVVDRAPPTARIQVRCRRCGKPVKAPDRRGRGPVRLSGFEGRLVTDGDQIEIRLAHPRTDRGRYRFGAIGKRSIWRIVDSRLDRVRIRCTEPGSSKQIPCP